MSPFALLPVPEERIGYPAPDDLELRRSGLRSAVAADIWKAVPEPVELLIGGVRCLSFETANRPKGIVLHLHGGAFRLGCPEQVAQFAAALADRCQVRVICPAYRLAPEYPFPAGLADARSVVTGLLESGTTRLVISGDSAGGGLAAGLAALFPQTGVRLAGLVLLSPWLDLSVSNSSYASNATSDPLFSAESAKIAASQYLQGLSPEHPLASPRHGSVKGFPPTFINVGSGEVLLDDSLQLYDRLHLQGIEVHLQMVEGMDHVAVTRGPNLSGSAETLQAVSAFISRTIVS